MVEKKRNDNINAGEQTPTTEIVERVEAIRGELAEIENVVGRSLEKAEPDADGNSLDDVATVDQHIDSVLSTISESGDEIRLVISEFSTIISILGMNFKKTREPLHILLTEEVASTLSDRFPINSYFQKLYDAPAIEIKQTNSTKPPLPSIAIIGNKTYYPVKFGTISTSMLINDRELNSQLVNEFETQFGEADELDIDIPPWGELLADLADATSQETADEFEHLVEAATPKKLDSLDEVSLALISAAKTGALQYNISKWGEEMNIASKATFSRRKSNLVDSGVITTESVPVETGRPRDRLLIKEVQPDSNSADTSQCESDEQSEQSITNEIDSDAEPNASTSDNHDTADQNDRQQQSKGGIRQPEDEIDKLLEEVLLLDE